MTVADQYIVHLEPKEQGRADGEQFTHDVIDFILSRAKGNEAQSKL